MMVVITPISDDNVRSQQSTSQLQRRWWWWRPLTALVFLRLHLVTFAQSCTSTSMGTASLSMVDRAAKNYQYNTTFSSRQQQRRRLSVLHRPHLERLNRIAVLPPPSPADPSFSVQAPHNIPKRQRRRATNTAGQHQSVLVVRIMNAPEDSVTTANVENELFVALFQGVNASSPSVKKQMMLCSRGRVILNPISDANSIVSVVISVPSGQENSRETWLETAAQMVMQIYFSSQLPVLQGDGTTATTTVTSYLNRLRHQADHVIMILPTSYPDTSFVGTADVNSSLSSFAATWITSLSSAMHELGHNLGLQHSGTNNDEYGDNSGYMGESVQGQGTPQKCYDAAQHWFLGWYDENQRISLTTDNLPLLPPQQITVAAFVDHNKLNYGNSHMAILLQLNGNTYLQFNRAKSYNAGTDTSTADRLVIVRDIGSRTVLLAGLDDVQNAVYQDGGWTVRVCRRVVNWQDESHIDYVVLAVSSSNNNDVSVCDGSLAVVTPPKNSNNNNTPAPTATMATITRAPSTATIASTTTTVSNPSNKNHNSTTVSPAINESSSLSQVALDVMLAMGGFLLLLVIVVAWMLFFFYRRRDDKQRAMLRPRLKRSYHQDSSTNMMPTSDYDDDDDESYWRQRLVDVEMDSNGGGGHELVFGGGGMRKPKPIYHRSTTDSTADTSRMGEDQSPLKSLTTTDSRTISP